MTIITFDLSLSNSGIAIFNDAGECIKLLSIDTNKGDTYPKRLKHIEKEFLKLRRAYKPDRIVFEESFTRFNKSTQAIYRVRGLAELVFYRAKQYCYHATTIRKEVLGKGNAKKEDVYNYACVTYPQLKFEDYDQSDAFAIGLCYFKRKGVLHKWAEAHIEK